MKHFFLLPALLLFSHTVVFSQGCLPEGITFTTQEQIDNFQANYPGCTEIEGDVEINDNFGNITNLNGLHAVTSIGGYLRIGFGLGSNPDLISLNGLENLTSIGGSLNIWDNNALTSLNGLENLISIGEWLSIYFNSYLTNVNGLASLNTIGGDLIIEFNNLLDNLTGLQNINAGSISNIMIMCNYSLSACGVQSICEYLAAPNGTIEIHNNAPGCNSPAEVETACPTSIKENASKDEITLFPNPATTFITIHINEGIAIEEAIIYNHLGQKALVAVPVNNTVDISGLRPGIYFIETTTKDWTGRTKLVKQ